MTLQLWSAFVVGLVGSLHCTGMCGALAVAIPARGTTRRSYVAGRLAYNGGRITTYCLLGLVFGLLGRRLAIAGLQRWTSIAAGTAILIGCVLSLRFGLVLPISRAVALVKAGLARQLQRRTLSSSFLLGQLNGLLPCGLVYVASTASIVTGGIASGILYMLAFGLGTLPLMLAVGLAGRNLQLALRWRYQKLIPLSLLVLGCLLVLRGLALGIPYVSPDLTLGHACH